MDEHTPGSLFVHDFADPAVTDHPTTRHVTLSCDHPATIEVAAMGSGLTGTLDEARANACRLAACWNALAGIPTAALESVAAEPDPYDRLARLAGLAACTAIDLRAAEQTEQAGPVERAEPAPQRDGEPAVPATQTGKVSDQSVK